ncbi:hypothetical protein CDO52_00670 [Nocardiopsis gilva YIM 90087]|uniref:Uncharacterized protein n=1 Tax=Nocardiopsis gilva YIM 90087 TaxID=1235441 RepID=A0A223S036_9ACTN|nr:hypothetical protein [Nocardiopsis gilva]ASU81492.1 hypothetical protein CDO52_00670 [Nocardiopsis gilva YIM 90087]
MDTDERRLTTKEAAAAAGMTPGGWRSMVSRGSGPLPDGRYDERTPWWYESTVQRFKASRRSRGRPRKAE